MSESKSDNSDKKTVIFWESPKTRPMDLSPARLAKELGWSINTVKNRVGELSLDFSINDDENPYQLYNHECLPILNAYVGRQNKDDSQNASFFERIRMELNNQPQQAFCRHFLYNDADFRKDHLRTYMENHIKQRIECIQKLATHLDINPHFEFNHPASIRSLENVLIQLDRFIFELTNFVPYEDTSAADKQCDSPKSKTDKEYATTWCNELIALRKKVFKDHRVNFILPKETQNPQEAVDAKLMRDGISDSEKAYAKKTYSFFENVDRHQKGAALLDDQGKTELKSEIEKAFKLNKDSYLTALFSLQITPVFQYPEDTKLSPLELDLASTVCQNICFSTEKLEKYFLALYAMTRTIRMYQNVYLLVNIPQEVPKEMLQLASLMRSLELQISECWHTMRSIGFFDDTSAADFYSLRFNESKIWNSIFNCDSRKDAVTDYLDSLVVKYEKELVEKEKSSFPENQSAHKNGISPKECIKTLDDIEVLFIAGAITIETFWNCATRIYASDMVNRCNEFRKALAPHIKLP